MTPRRKPAPRTGPVADAQRAGLGAELRTYEFFIPLTAEASGLTHPPALFDDWETETSKVFRGLTRLGLVQGWWFDSDRGSVARDESWGYLIAISPAGESELVKHIAVASRTFGQKCIFLERRGAAFLIHPPGHDLHSTAPRLLEEPPVVREQSPSYGERPGLRPSEAAFVGAVRERIERDDGYLAVLDFALGPRSPLLQGRLPHEVQSRAAYIQVRNLVTEYGRSLGLLASASARAADADAGRGLRVAEAVATYGSARPRCVSQLRAAALLGLTPGEVRAAIADGRLASRHEQGATVVEQAAVERMSRNG